MSEGRMKNDEIIVMQSEPKLQVNLEPKEPQLVVPNAPASRYGVHE